MIVADALVKKRRQGINNNYADTIVKVVAPDIYIFIYIHIYILKHISFYPNKQGICNPLFF